jgi:glycosyltransferase involved in cell wall biosynthesis
MLPAAASQLSRNQTATELLESARQYLVQEDFEAARSCLKRTCNLPDCHPNALSLAGILLVRMSLYDEAVSCFRRLLEATPEDFDARHNLALAFLLDGKPDLALSEFKRLAKYHPGRAEPWNDMGVLWRSLNRLPRALACYRRAMRKDFNNTAVLDNAMQCCLEAGLPATGRRLLERHVSSTNQSNDFRSRILHWRRAIETAEHAQTTIGRKSSAERESPRIAAGNWTAPKKIAFFASHRTFIGDIIKHLGVTNEVRIFDGTTVAQMNELLAWADLAWFEWCDDLLIQGTRLPRQCPVICRLHSYEAFTDMPSRVDWSKVDHLVFVNQSVRELAMPQIRRAVPTSIVHNGLDLDRFTIPGAKTAGKKIASVGYINYKKNPALLLYCFKKIHEYDHGYSLHIAGEHQDARIQLYFEQFLRNNPLPVHFDGWVKDMPEWYADKDFVISTSLFESFHYSIAEGMASGLMPLIHNWYGAGNVYPKEYLFEDPDDCLKLLKRLEKADRRAAGESNRAYISDHYDLKKTLNEISSLVDSILYRAIKQPAARHV